MAELRFGRSLVRREDERLMRGQGTYTADVTLPGMLHLAMVRCPHPCARIVGIDAEEALALPGVIAVLTGADAAADGFESVLFAVTVKRSDDRDAARTPRPCLG